MVRRRESGRPCGCDPSCDHPCEGHAAHRDDTITTIPCVADELGSVQLAVTGPTDAGTIQLTFQRPMERGNIGIEIELHRFEAEDLINDLIRRLLPRK